ncbi:ribonuclease P protein component [Amycolatopsis keratiniphila]|uniref:Ribonuclease P protein component n=1 Tax=Amycolatopsis keratiniphila subsp. keratiniphila TaxID=227715 RepID=A0A1W2LJS9_9PSEU|nr:ribonuclease P protein component [Amycolatopsis keratiniphila]OLZ59895.1 ribonuclease P protein component [Amycolatopsis keratiniphila subsp. nogabecina]ONF62884.1 ribonuclease P protein component [Amycolatopsis keratiniphila subsp. keratiniphila]SDU56159.1 ribonuclease P protein component [Amycolatopsis keratiniphila]
MLPAAARLRRSEDFRAVMRRGAKAGRRRLVVHALTTDPPDAAEAARAGFVVSKAVGNSVVRHRVTRRLRHLVSARIGTLPPGSTLVIRALPPAADASSAELGSDLDASLRRLGLSRQTRPSDHGSAV